MAASDKIAQEVRLRRFGAAVVTSLLFIGLLWLACVIGVLPMRFATVGTLAVLTCIVGFFALLRSGRNQLLSDPSLTVPMILASCAVNTYILYGLQAGRGAFLLVYLMSMLFGVFRLKTQELLALAALILLQYALVVWGHAVRDPATFDVKAELLQLLVLALVLLWFARMGGYINKLVMRLSQSELDELTGIYTRRRILEILRHEKLRADRGAGPLCICLLDVDRLKWMNDSHGHLRGDMMLKLVANAATSQLRSVDYIGRYGGDEYLIVLTQTSLTGGRDFAERIRRAATAASVSDTEYESPVTVSIGIAQYDPGENTTLTVGRADAALYRAKQMGRNRIESAPIGEQVVQPDSDADVTSPAV